MVSAHSVGKYFGKIRGIYTFKSLKAKRSHLDRTASQHNAPVEGDADPGNPGINGGKGGVEVISGIRQHIINRHLRTGQHDGNLQVLKHEREHGSCICHGIRTVGYDDAVILFQIFKNIPRNFSPFFRLDIGAVQT